MLTMGFLNCFCLDPPYCAVTDYHSLLDQNTWALNFYFKLTSHSRRPWLLLLLLRQYISQCLLQIILLMVITAFTCSALLKALRMPAAVTFTEKTSVTFDGDERLTGSWLVWSKNDDIFRFTNSWFISYLPVKVWFGLWKNPRALVAGSLMPQMESL